MTLTLKDPMIYFLLFYLFIYKLIPQLKKFYTLTRD